MIISSIRRVLRSFAVENTPRQPQDMHMAFTEMRRANPQAMVGEEDNHAVMIEDWSDPDGRMYRMEYQCTPDARHAIAFCRHNPWGSVNGGEELGVGHVADDGLLCMGNGHSYSRDSRQSAYDLKTAIQRGRYWCTAFSVLKETGGFPQP